MALLLSSFVYIPTMLASSPAQMHRVGFHDTFMREGVHDRNPLVVARRAPVCRNAQNFYDVIIERHRKATVPTCPSFYLTPGGATIARCDRWVRGAPETNRGDAGFTKDAFVHHSRPMNAEAPTQRPSTPRGLPRCFSRGFYEQPPWAGRSHRLWRGLGNSGSVDAPPRASPGADIESQRQRGPIVFGRVPGVLRSRQAVRCGEGGEGE